MYPVLITFIVVGLPVILIFLLLLAKILKGGKANGLGAEDLKIMQEMHRSLNRLEDRIDQLEILLDDQKPKNNQH